MRCKLALLALPLLAVSLGAAAALLRSVPPTKPNDVVQVGEGVYFRHGDLAASGHCNNGIIVFAEFVLVVDANFPSGAEACLADIRKLTQKPARFVFDTHHHGDHAYGNPVWVKAGVVPVAHEGVAREMARVEPGRWREALGREDVKSTGLEAPVPPRVTFPDRMVFDDGTQRVELLHFGHAHTRGDGFAYLPRQKILFTGDAVVNGPHNFMGDGNTESWLEVIQSLRQLDVEIVVPGHGPAGDRALLDDQYEFIASLRAEVAKGVEAGKSVEEMVKSVTVPERVRRYVGDMFGSQIAKVRSEMLALELPRELERLGFTAGPPTKGPGWAAPRKLVYHGEAVNLLDLKHVAPELRVVVATSDAEALREVADADAFIGRITPQLIEAGKKLRWVHSISAGVEGYVGHGDDAPGIERLLRSDIVLTNGKRCYGPNIADQAMAFLLALSRQVKSNIEGKAVGGTSRWKGIDPGPRQEIELRGKTMVIVGLGGIGSEVALRAAACGMRVLGVDPHAALPMEGVREIHRPGGLLAALRGAHALVIACPLTRETRGSVRAEHLAALADGAFVINVARGKILDPDALVAALQSGKLGGAGLDVTEPEPLPDASPLWRLENVIISPHNAGQSDGSRRRIQLLLRENARRFAAGQPLLNVVDKSRGY